MTLEKSKNKARRVYLFGFNGQLKDNELYGSGNAYSFKFRMYGPRLGRFMSIDPLSAKYPFYSPYIFSGDRVIDMRELEGLEPVRYAKGFHGQQGTNYGFGSMGASVATNWQQSINGRTYQIYKCPNCYTSQGNSAGTGLAGNTLMWQGKTWQSSSTTTSNSSATPLGSSETLSGTRTVSAVTNGFVAGQAAPTPALQNSIRSAQNALNAPVNPTHTTGSTPATTSTSTGPVYSNNGQTRTTVIQTTTTQQIQTTTQQNVVSISFNTTQGNNSSTSGILQQRFNNIANSLGNPGNLIYNPAGNGYGMPNAAMGGGVNQVIIGSGVRTTTNTGVKTINTTTTKTGQRKF